MTNFPLFSYESDRPNHEYCKYEKTHEYWILLLVGFFSFFSVFHCFAIDFNSNQTITSVLVLLLSSYFGYTVGFEVASSQADAT